MVIGIAISGKLASGKTTAAQALVDELGFTLVRFAAPLKWAAAEIADWLFDTFRGRRDVMVLGDIVERLKDKTTPEGRAWLQFLGTDVMRKVYPNIWVRAFLSKVEREGLQKVVVDDVRFRNEAEVLQRAGFLMLRIEAPENVRKARLPQGYPESAFLHPSETDLDDYQDWHHVIDGRERVEDFKAAVLSTVQAWMIVPSSGSPSGGT